MYSNDLSDRQKALLKMIIEEYISNADPISSNYLTKKYGLNISAATVRNEMAELIRKGYLVQPHVSAGRVPTTTAYRLYIKELMDSTELPVLKEVAMKQNVWNSRFELDKSLRSAATSLASATNLLSVISLSDGRTYSSGVVNILDYIEFFEIDVARAVLNLIDNYTHLQEILSKRNVSGTCVLLGEDFERENLYPVSVVSKSYNSGGLVGYVSVIGPARLPYKDVIPAVKYMSDVLEELTLEW